MLSRNNPPATGLAETHVGESETQSTVELLGLARAGRADALNALFARCLPSLRRWAQGRLPAVGRDLFKTGDLVRDTVVSVLGRLNTFEAHQEGALLAHLREAVMNRIADVSRRFARSPRSRGTRQRSRRHWQVSARADDRRRAHAPVQTPRCSASRRCTVRPSSRASNCNTATSKSRRRSDRPNASAARSLVVRALYRLYQELPHAE